MTMKDCKAIADMSAKIAQYESAIERLKRYRKDFSDTSDEICLETYGVPLECYLEVFVSGKRFLASLEAEIEFYKREIKTFGISV